MDNRYNRDNRRKYSFKVHIVLVTKYRKQLLKDSIADDVNDIANTYGTNMVRFCLNSIRRKKYFGQTDILLAALEKYRQLPYKNILRIRLTIKDLQGSSHHLKVVGGAYGKRKGFIYEPISTQNKKDRIFFPSFLSSFH